MGTKTNTEGMVTVPRRDTGGVKPYKPSFVRRKIETVTKGDVKESGGGPGKTIPGKM